MKTWKVALTAVNHGLHRFVAAQFVHWNKKFRKINNQNLINKLVNSLHTDLQNIVGNQLLKLLRQPNPSTNNLSAMIFSEDQYKIFNILTNSWGLREHLKHPYFFLTGSAGTGKSFMIQQIVNFLNTKYNILLINTFYSLFELYLKLYKKKAIIIIWQ